MKPRILLLIPFLCMVGNKQTIKWQGFSCCKHGYHDFFLGLLLVSKRVKIFISHCDIMLFRNIRI